MIKKINPKNFGDLVREVRNLNGISQNQLAINAGISSETIRRIETQYNIPKIDVIDNISKVLKTDLLLAFLELNRLNPISYFYTQLDELILELTVPGGSPETVIVTVAMLLSTVPSFVLNVKESTPSKFGSGV